MAIEKKKIGIIGCGTVVQKNYTRLFHKLKGMDVQYVNDVNEQNAKIVSGLMKAQIATAEKVLENSDYVLIATPPRFHAELVQKAIDYGVDIICEKPFVTSRNEAQGLVEKAKAKGVRLYLAHFRRGYPSAQLARQIIRTGLLGNITNLLIVEGGRFNWITKSDYIRQDTYGGVLFDTGSHTIDLALYASAMDLDAYQVTVQDVWRDKAEPAHEIKSHLRLDNSSRSIAVQLYLSRRQALANKITITGERGRIDLSALYQTKIRLSGPDNSGLIYADREYRDGADCMNMLYHQIINKDNGEIYLAERAITLTSILEEVHKKQGNE